MFNCEIDISKNKWYKIMGIPAKPKYAGYFEFNIPVKGRYTNNIKLKRTRDGNWYLEYTQKKQHIGYNGITYPGSIRITGIKTYSVHKILQINNKNNPDFVFIKPGYTTN